MSERGGEYSLTAQWSGLWNGMTPPTIWRQKGSDADPQGGRSLGTAAMIMTEDAKTEEYTAKSLLILLFAFVLLFGAGFLFVLPRGMVDVFSSLALQCYALGLLPLAFSILLLLEYKKMKLTVSEDGVAFRNRLGRTKTYSWDQVKVRTQFYGKRAIIFYLDEKTVWIGSHYKNYSELSDWLVKNEKYEKEYIS